MFSCSRCAMSWHLCNDPTILYSKSYADLHPLPGCPSHDSAKLTSFVHQHGKYSAKWLQWCWKLCSTLMILLSRKALSTTTKALSSLKEKASWSYRTKNIAQDPRTFHISRTRYLQVICNFETSFDYRACLVSLRTELYLSLKSETALNLKMFWQLWLAWSVTKHKHTDTHTIIIVTTTHDYKWKAAPTLTNHRLHIFTQCKLC